MKFTTTSNMTEVEKTNVWWANQIQEKNAEIERLQEHILAMTYKIDFDNLTIECDESNGVKHFIKLTYRNGPHVLYVNDDGSIWAQLLTKEDAIALELATTEAPYTASDYGMEVRL